MDQTRNKRQLTWREKQHQAGKKSLSVMLPRKIIDRLHRVKGKKENMSKFVEQILIDYLDQKYPDKSLHRQIIETIRSINCSPHVMINIPKVG